MLLIVVFISSAVATSPLINNSGDGNSPSIPTKSEVSSTSQNYASSAPTNNNISASSSSFSSAEAKTGKGPESCPLPARWRPTCAVPNPQQCPRYPNVNENQDGCVCKPGYILSKKGGKCIKIEDCPKNLGCNRDPNAVIKSCPLACPPTCSTPNARPCMTKRCLVGCECKPGYIKSKENDKCILPDNCPGGNPCGQNGTFVGCKYNCPTNYCPVDDSRGILICETSPFAPCLPGCNCKINYRMKSRDDETCILAAECPPVECTRPNEEWAPCPSDCLAESCDDVDLPPAQCNTLLLNCQPKCICKKGYFRNEKDICIPANDCPKRRNKC